MTKQETINKVMLEAFTYDPITGLCINRKTGKARQGKSYVGLNKKIDGVVYMMQAHRFAYLVMTGSIPEMVDHRDLETTNNKWLNLREATNGQNQANTRRSRSNTSGVKGVSFHKRDGKYQARIKVDGKLKHLGYHNTLAQAEQVVIAARTELHGNYANHG